MPLRKAKNAEIAIIYFNNISSICPKIKIADAKNNSRGVYYA